MPTGWKVILPTGRFAKWLELILSTGVMLKTQYSFCFLIFAKEEICQVVERLLVPTCVYRVTEGCSPSRRSWYIFFSISGKEISFNLTSAYSYVKNGQNPRQTKAMSQIFENSLPPPLPFSSKLFSSLSFPSPIFSLPLVSFFTFLSFPHIKVTSTFFPVFSLLVLPPLISFVPFFRVFLRLFSLHFLCFLFLSQQGNQSYPADRSYPSLRYWTKWKCWCNKT